ncbi:MAG: sigma 54-interacting transcriptional regulator [Gemmatimonadales bacterium]
MTGFDPASQLSMLREITGRLAAGQRLEDVLTTITSVLVERAGIRSVAIWLYLFDEECKHCRDLPVTDPPNGRRLHRVARSTNPPVVAFEHLHTLPLSEAFAEQVSRDRSPTWYNELLELGHLISVSTGGGPSLPTAEEWGASAAEEGILAGALFPLFVGDDLTGFMFLMKDGTIGAHEVQCLQVFALQAASIIRSARLYHEVERLRDHLALENAYLEEAVREEAGFAEIVGNSAVLQDVLRLIRQVAPTDSTVLLCGETGTGKELVARAIHGASRRAGHPIIKVNSGGLSPGLVDSELFGHERGAFTGATQRRIGRFELADGGTLFLDEVAELPGETQVKLLRVLQEREFERVGGERTLRVDVRLIAATHRDLDEEVAAGRFRSDLYYRLNVFPLVIPPLRERPEDIGPLAQHFVAHFGRRLGKPLTGISRGSFARLNRYPWPGNIRELQNVIERACVLATGPVVDVPEPALGATRAAAWHPATLEVAERAHILRTLERTGWRVEGDGGAAALLGLRPSTLRSRLHRLGIQRADRRRSTVRV